MKGDLQVTQRKVQGGTIKTRSYTGDYRHVRRWQKRAEKVRQRSALHRLVCNTDARFHGGVPSNGLTRQGGF